MLSKKAEMIDEVYVRYTYGHRYAKASHAAGIPLTNITAAMDHSHKCIIKVINESFQTVRLICLHSEAKGHIHMEKRLNSLKYFAPKIQIALSPVTILFLFNVFTGPKSRPELMKN